MVDQAHPDDLPTLRSRYAHVLVWCKACPHQRQTDLQGLVDAGPGDVPPIKLRFWCANCSSR
jgi:hypothetical protein